jgi:hypothetical protein
MNPSAIEPSHLGHRPDGMAVSKAVAWKPITGSRAEVQRVLVVQSIKLF